NDHPESTRSAAAGRNRVTLRVTNPIRAGRCPSASRLAKPCSSSAAPQRLSAGGSPSGHLKGLKIHRGQPRASSTLASGIFDPCTTLAGLTSARPELPGELSAPDTECAGHNEPEARDPERGGPPADHRRPMGQHPGEMEQSDQRE